MAVLCILIVVARKGHFLFVTVANLSIGIIQANPLHVPVVASC